MQSLAMAWLLECDVRMLAHAHDKAEIARLRIAS